MLSQVLGFIFWLFVAFTVSHYTLSQFFSNSKAVVVSAAIFAVLVVLFASRSLVL